MSAALKAPVTEKGGYSTWYGCGNCWWFLCARSRE